MLSNLPIDTLGEISKYLSQRDLSRLRQTEKSMNKNVGELSELQREKVHFGFYTRRVRNNVYQVPFFKFKSKLMNFSNDLTIYTKLNGILKDPLQSEEVLQDLPSFINSIGNKNKSIMIYTSDKKPIVIKLDYIKSTHTIIYTFLQSTSNMIDNDEDEEAYDNVMKYEMHADKLVHALIDFENYLQQ